MPKTKVKTLNKELEETRVALARALADYANLEKRVQGERTIIGKLALVKLVSKFLPVLDNLNAAVLHTKDDGILLVVKQFKQVLDSEGIKEVGEVGEKFDPKLHEAVEVVKGKNEDKICQLISPGFMIDGQVIRPAKVKVEKTQVEKEPQEKAQKAQDFGDYA